MIRVSLWIVAQIAVILYFLVCYAVPEENTETIGLWGKICWMIGSIYETAARVTMRFQHSLLWISACFMIGWSIFFATAIFGIPFMILSGVACMKTIAISLLIAAPISMPWAAGMCSHSGHPLVSRLEEAFE